MTKLPRISDVRVLSVVASTGSTKAAAQQLYTTVSSINKQLVRLQDSFTNPLFTRIGAKVKLTRHGDELVRAFQYSQLIFIDGVKAASFDTHMRIKIFADAGIGLKFILPRLFKGIELINPDFKLDWVSSKEEADIMIVRHDIQQPIDALLYRIDVIADDYIAPVIAPNNVKYPSLLRAHNRVNVWARYLHKQPFAKLINKEQYFDQQLYAIEAAKTGLGYAVASIYAVADDITQQLLISTEPFTPDHARYLLMSKHHLNEQLIDRTADYFKQEFAMVLSKMSRYIAQ